MFPLLITELRQETGWGTGLDTKPRTYSLEAQVLVQMSVEFSFLELKP